MIYENIVLLGVNTLFGDSDVVQTHIQLWGFLLGILTLVGLMYTINLQRIAIEEQNRINSKQMKLFELDLREKHNNIAPKFQLLIRKPDNKVTHPEGVLQLSVDSSNTVIINSIGIVELTAEFFREFSVFEQNIGAILNNTSVDLVSIVHSDQFFALSQLEKTKTGSPNPDIRIEVFYSTIDQLHRYRDEYKYVKQELKKTKQEYIL